MAGMVLLCIIAGLIFMLHKMSTSKLNYWKENGIPHITPMPYIGNMSDNFLKKKSFGQLLKDTGEEFKDEPLVGFYNYTRPSLLIDDPEYAEIVLVKEFSSFMNRREELKTEERRPFDKHLFFLTGSTWKGVRSKLTPVFKTAKLKGMLAVIERLFDKTFKAIENTDEAINLYDIVEKFTLRVRASCVFGIDLLKSDTAEAEFVERVKSMSRHSVSTLAQTVIALFFPRLAKLFNLSFFGADNEKYYVEVLLKSFKERSKTKDGKQDLVQTLMELKNKGKIEVKYWAKEDDYLKTEEKHLATETVEMDDDILISQSLIFLVAGLEPELSALTILLVEISKNPRVFDKLNQEIDSTIDQHKEFSFQALKEMEYLQLCIQETLRVHTAADVLVRHSCTPYTFPNGTTVDKGIDVMIPLLRYHLDPTIYPEPFTFKPERFVQDSQPPYAYLPFGSGPRICIGFMDTTKLTSVLHQASWHDQAHLGSPPGFMDTTKLTSVLHQA